MFNKTKGDNYGKNYIYIFEPCNWAYCSGAIAIIAENFEQAVRLAREKCTRANGGEQYDGVFSRDRKDMEEDYWDQWLLTEEFEVLDDKGSRVVLNNWNYG